MAAAETLLSTEQKIIEVEATLTQLQFFRRLTLLWMFAGNTALTALLVGANFAIDWSDIKSGQSGLNIYGCIAVGASILSSAWWANHRRGKISETLVELRKLEAERRSLQAGDPDQQSIPSAFHAYFESIPSYRDEYRRSAEKYRSRHNLFQLTVIIGSILTSVSTTASAEQGFWSWFAVAVSAFVSISAGIISYFKFRERSLNLQQTADSIDLELAAYSLRIRRYKNLSHEEASATFAEEVERLREEQRKKELQLEQPPEASPQRNQAT
ncbi:DUF4231 domain-containing protein [Streptomyces sp. NPDC092369]|uniref:DUF4231 domain-containing protein n=1 Tax=Streptomyces sp. NPDC092369 TaxID=3366015 RepID=UPI00382E5697